jgi:hypothetical protein
LSDSLMNQQQARAMVAGPRCLQQGSDEGYEKIATHVRTQF